MAHYVIYNQRDKKFVGGMFHGNKLYQVNTLWIMVAYDWSYKPFDSDFLSEAEICLDLPSGSLINHKFTEKEEHYLKSFKLSEMALDALNDFLSYADSDIDRDHITALANSIITSFKDKLGYNITKGYQ